MKVIIISGPPAAGKTTIARKLSEELEFEYFSKDMFKEELYDTYSKSNILHNKWYDQTAKSQFFKRLEEKVLANESCIIESNFEPGKDMQILENLLVDIDIRELYCTASGWSIFGRFVARRELRPGEKHLKHHDRMWYPQMFVFSLLKTCGLTILFTPLKISPKLLCVDTSDFSKVDLHKIVAFCK